MHTLNGDEEFETMFKNPEVVTNIIIGMLECVRPCGYSYTETVAALIEFYLDNRKFQCF